MMKLLCSVIVMAMTLTVAFAEDKGRDPSCDEQLYKDWVAMGNPECRALKPMFQYNYRKDKCEPFNFGGCPTGWKNAYQTMAECEKKCKPLNNAVSTRNAAIDDKAIARHPNCTTKLYADMDGHKCKALVRSFQFNPTTKQCETFNWGGCPDLPNRFVSLRDCIKFCDPPGLQKEGVYTKMLKMETTTTKSTTMTIATVSSTFMTLFVHLIA